VRNTAAPLHDRTEIEELRYTAEANHGRLRIMSLAGVHRDNHIVDGFLRSDVCRQDCNENNIKLSSMRRGIFRHPVFLTATTKLRVQDADMPPINGYIYARQHPLCNAPRLINELRDRDAFQLFTYLFTYLLKYRRRLRVRRSYLRRRKMHLLSYKIEEASTHKSAPRRQCYYVSYLDL